MSHLFGREGLIVLIIVLILFGGKKIPEFAKGLGKGIREFKGAMNGEGEDDNKTLKKPDPPSEDNRKS